MADGNQNRQNAPAPPTLLSEFRLRLLGDPLPNAKRPPTLGFKIAKNGVQIEVRTNIENDKDYGRILAKPSISDFFSILSLLEKVATGPAGEKYTIGLKASRFISGQPSKEPMLDTKVVVGKDNDGVIFMGVLSWEKERPVIKFPFRPFNDNRNETTWTKGDGTALSPAEISSLYYAGWLRVLESVVPTLLINGYTPPPPRDNAGGGGGGYGGGGGGGQRQGGYGGGQRQGGGGGYGGGGGGGRPPAEAAGDDDFPM